MNQEITYLKGDATAPVGEGNKLIIHVCNDVGGWGAGFVLALSRKWAEPEKRYRQWACSLTSPVEEKIPFKLGYCQLVNVEPGLWVVNMIGQRGVRFVDGVPPIRYEAIERCLKVVAKVAQKLGASVHGPKFGSALAGGDWNRIEALINDNVCGQGIETTIYEFD